MNPASLPSLTVMPDEYRIIRYPSSQSHRELVTRWLLERAQRPESTPPDAKVDSVESKRWLNITWGRDELSLVLGRADWDDLRRRVAAETSECQVSRTRRMLKVQGPLPLEWVGILAGIAKVLAEADVSLFCVATFDTDYLLVASEQIEQAVAALKQAGYPVAVE